MATITVTPGHTYGTTDTVTSTNLNDLGSPTAALTAGSILTADIADANVTTAKIADANVTTAKIADSNVTTAKIANANVTFAKLTNVIDDDTMATATDTTLATSESIKAYVDEYNLKYSGSTGTISVTTSFTDWDLSSVVGSNRAMVIIELWDSSTFISLIAKTKGSLVETYLGSSFGGWGASGLVVSSTNQGGTIAVITNELGVIEIKGTASASAINYEIQAYQKLA